MKQTFNKRTFDMPLLVKSAAMAVVSAPRIFMALRKPTTSRALQEQVMLAVTSVNDCRYCDWVHTGLALEEGVNIEELAGLLNHDAPQSPDTQEAVAILFAQHFADTLRQPSAQAQQRLADTFSDRQQQEILAFIHAIYFANLSGNSFDALIARLKGDKIANGHLVAETIASMLSAPVLMGIWLKGQNAKTRPLARLY
jgi:AhpD family alkylhydroperoxidase